MNLGWQMSWRRHSMNSLHSTEVNIPEWRWELGRCVLFEKSKSPILQLGIAYVQQLCAHCEASITKCLRQVTHRSRMLGGECSCGAWKMWCKHLQLLLNESCCTMPSRWSVVWQWSLNPTNKCFSLDRAKFYFRVH